MVEKVFDSIAIGNLTWNLIFKIETSKLKLILYKKKIQFFAVMTHSVVNAFASDCSFPKAFSISYLVYGFITTLLFLNFYSNSYKKNKSSADSKRAIQERKTQ